MTTKSYRFGPYELFPTRRLLVSGNQQIPLGGRALEILLALVERPGELLTKDELIERAWPGMLVEEANLRVNVAALRKALGSDKLIANVAGRGYMFVAPVELSTEVPSSHPGEIAARHLLVPRPIACLVGRDGALAELVGQMAERRLVTLTGVGGSGKSALALHAVHRFASERAIDAIRIDVDDVRDGVSLAGHFAETVGVTIPDQEQATHLVLALRDRTLCVMIDNADRLLSCVADLADLLLRYTTNVSLLVTCREPLRVETEWIHRLNPLEVPSDGIDGLERIDRYGAVQLFVERAAEALGGFELDAGNAPHVVGICRSLDGLPLAIELAARRLEVACLHEVARTVACTQRHLTQNERRGKRRHRSLWTTFESSYQRLDGPEKLLLKRLSLVETALDLGSLVALGSAAGLDADLVDNLLSKLIAKSLIVLLCRGASTAYGLLQTFRAFLREATADLDEISANRNDGPSGQHSEPRNCQ